MRSINRTAPICWPNGGSKSVTPKAVFPNQLQLGEAIASKGRYSLAMEQLQCSHHATAHRLLTALHGGQTPEDGVPAWSELLHDSWWYDNREDLSVCPRAGAFR